MSAGSEDDRRAFAVDARWRQVLEVAREAYVAVDGSGCICDWNRRAEEAFGWSREEAVGMPVAGLVRDGAERFVQRLLRGRDEEPFDLLAVDRRGRPFPAQCSVWGVDRRGGSVVHAFVHDVTDRRRAEESAALLTAVVDGTGDAVVTSDLQGVILAWNAGDEQTYGWSAEEAVGRADSLFVPGDKHGELRDLVRRLHRGERVAAVETERLTRGGTRVPVSLTLSPVRDATGRLVGMSAVDRDVTEQRWMAQTLDATLEALQAAADEARSSAAATQRFLADAAHQLRTPVAGIRACAETLLRGAPAADHERLLAMIGREAAHAGALVSSLLRMARLDQGLAVSGEPVDVAAVCAEEVTRLGLLRPDLDVWLDVRQELGGTLLLDRAALAEVLSNLGDNAVRHARRRVELLVEAGRDEVRVRVVDDGPGVPDGLRQEVFERFVSLDGLGGSGLGLPIARALAGAMGGHLHCDGDFVLSLPRGHHAVVLPSPDGG